MAARIARIELRRISAPLVTPYRISQHTYATFDPLVAEVVDEDGRSGWGEAGITPGLTLETAAGGWQYLLELAPRLAGLEPAEAQVVLVGSIHGHEHAASTLMTALEMLQDSPDLHVPEPVAIPLLAPLHEHGEERLADEIETRLAEGWRTLKVKVGFDVHDDLDRVRFIRSHTLGRATLRLDANQAYSVPDAVLFATNLEPEGIELFEQPCSMRDWAANAQVAAVSALPVMLDEIVHSRTDIERAATLPGVRFVKLKLKKMGGAARVGNWCEACVARTTIRNAGELNGFLKLRRPLLAEPLQVADGALHLRPGRLPPVDREWLAQITEETAIVEPKQAVRGTRSAA